MIRAALTWAHHGATDSAGSERPCTRLPALGEELGFLRWHRELVARKWTYGGARPSRAGLQAHLRALVVRLATENPTWGYTRIQGALKNVGHRVGRSTIARILRTHGIPPGGQRATPCGHLCRLTGQHWWLPTSSQPKVWTARGLVTYYTAIVIELQSRRVQVLGSTPYPDEAFVIQCPRQATSEPDALLREGRILVCDPDPKWSRAVEQWLSTAGGRVIRAPPCAPNCHTQAERFVRSVKEECLDRIVPLGEWHLRGTLREFATHYHREPPRTCQRAD